MRKGTVLTFRRDPGGQLSAAANALPLVTVRSSPLAAAVFDIYFGEQPVSKRAKKVRPCPIRGHVALLGLCSPIGVLFCIRSGNSELGAACGCRPRPLCQPCSQGGSALRWYALAYWGLFGVCCNCVAQNHTLLWVDPQTHQLPFWVSSPSHGRHKNNNQQTLV